jgi:hypothetical protein
MAAAEMTTSKWQVWKWVILRLHGHRALSRQPDPFGLIFASQVVAGELAGGYDKMNAFSLFRAHQLKEGSILVELCATCNIACQGQQCDGQNYSRPHGCSDSTTKEK